MEILNTLKEIVKSSVILTYLFGLTSIILAILLYFKSRKSKKPIYWMRTFNLLKEQEEFPGLSILYEGTKVNTVSVTKIAFLNIGNETIDSKDITRKEPFRIEIKSGFRILDKKIAYIRNNANDIRIIEETEQNNVLKIDFDYLDKGDGAIFQVIHNCASPNDISLKGSIKGVPNILERKKRKKNLDAIIGKLVTISIVILSMMIINYSSSRELGIFILCIIVFMIVSSKISSKLPENLIDIYDEQM